MNTSKLCLFGREGRRGGSGDGAAAARVGGGGGVGTIARVGGGGLDLFCDIVCSVSNTSETIYKNTSAIRKLAAAIVDTRQKSLLR